MTPSDLKSARFALRLSVSEFAAALGVDPRTIQRYEAKERDIPGSVEVLVDLLLHCAQARERRGLKAYPVPRVA